MSPEEIRAMDIVKLDSVERDVHALHKLAQVLKEIPAERRSQVFKALQVLLDSNPNDNCD